MMTVIVLKILFSVLLTIFFAALTVFLIYWCLTVLTFITALVGFHSISAYFQSKTIAFSSALERAYKNIRYRKDSK